jgi:glycosyltransferase involved in cell wall biosynthesis
MSFAILANELAKKGVKVTLVSLWKGNNIYDLSWICINGVKILEVSTLKKNIFIITYKLFRILLIEKPTIVYSAMPYSNLIAQLCCFILNINHIASIRINPSDFFKKKIFKKIAFLAILFIQSNINFISRKALNDYLSTFYGQLLFGKKFTVLHNPIHISKNNTNDYLLEKIKKTKKLINNIINPPIIVSNDLSVLNFVIVSRLVDGKGIMETLEQIKVSIRNYPFYLSIFGVGPLEKLILEFISRESLKDKIFLKGFNCNIENVYADSDIVIFPSRSEGFGRVPFEGMLMGNLVLCNDSVSIIEEFVNAPIMWKDYHEPLNLKDCLSSFLNIDPNLCIEEINKIKYALSPFGHALHFEKIAYDSFGSKL